MRAFPIAMFVAACGSSGDAPVDPPVTADAAPDTQSVDCTPFGDCEWLAGYQHRIVLSLAGGNEIAPGVTLAHRASTTERAATREFLLDELTALGLAPELNTYSTGANVIATLPATTGTGELIVVGAHFDSVPAGPGAADNATGVAIVLAVARYLATIPVREHPIAFALFDEEELGLIGSKAYVASLVAAETPVSGAHIFDMLSFDGDGDHAVELWSPSAPIATLYEQHGVLAAMPISSVTFSRSDHQAFLDAGFPAAGVGEEFVGGDHTPDYHKATDTYDRISFEHLALVTQLAMTVLETHARTP